MSRIHLFTKQKELNAQENEKYLAIQEFKCNISPSNLEAEDMVAVQNDQTNQQIIQDKLEIIFDVSSHESKINPEMSHQLSENSYINKKNLNLQKRSQVQSNAGLESLIYSQSSSNIIRDKRHEGQVISLSRFKDLDDSNSKVGLDTQIKDVQVRLSHSDNISVHRKQTHDDNQLIQRKQSTENLSYLRQVSTIHVWYIMRQLMKIVKNKRLQNLLQRISPFISDKSYVQQNAQMLNKFSKQQQFMKQELYLQERQMQTNNNLDGNENFHRLSNKQLHSTCQQFSLISTIYDVFSMVIAFASLIYYSILLLIYPTLDNGTTSFRYFFFGIFLSCFILDIFKELIPLSLQNNKKILLSFLFTWKTYLRQQLSYDIFSLLAIIFIEFTFPKLKSQLSFISIILLIFLFFKSFTIIIKWRRLQRIVQYSQRLTTSVLLINLFAQLVSILHLFSIIYYIILLTTNSIKQLIGYYLRDKDMNSWLTISGQNQEFSIIIIYSYAFQSCYLQVFHEILYQPQTDYEIYFFYFLQLAISFFCLHIIDTIFYNNKYTKQHYEEFLVMCKYIGEKNMSLSQKIELFNLINIKIEKDYEQKSIEVYKQYTQNISRPLQKYFQMIYFEHLLKQKVFSPLFSKELLKKSCRIVEEIFFQDKETIYDEQNDEEISLFIIIEGKVSIQMSYENGEVDFQEKNPKLIQDSLIGYYSFFSGMRKNFVYTAHDKVRLLKIPREAFVDILVKESEIDYQKFCEIKDRLLFDSYINSQENENTVSSIHSRQKLNQFCWACQSSNHDITECTKCHFVVDKLELVLKEQQIQMIQRTSFQRKQYKKMRLFHAFNKIQVGLKKFVQKNKSFLSIYEQSYLQTQNNPLQINVNNNENATNSRTFFSTSEHQIPTQYSKKSQNVQITQESHRNISNKLIPGLQNNNPMASPNISIHAKDRSFSIQSLINLQLQDSNKPPIPDSQFKTNNSIPYVPKQQQPIQNSIQEESVQTIQSSKRNTLAQLYPEKIQSDLNHGINLYPNTNTIPSSTYKNLKLKKYEDIYDENNPLKGESPLNSQYNLSKLSNNFTPSSKQNLPLNQNFGDFKQYLLQQQSKNDVIVLQVEENIPPNVYEFNLNRPYESNNEFSLNVQYKNSGVEYLNRGGQLPSQQQQMITFPIQNTQKQISSNIYSNLQYKEDISDCIQDPSFANSNNYQESTVFRQERQITLLDLDKLFITKSYFTDYNIDVILNFIKSKHQDQSKKISTLAMNEQFTFNKKSIQSPITSNRKKIDFNENPQKE